MPASLGPPVPGPVAPYHPCALLPDTMAESPLPPRPAALGSPLASGSSPLGPPRWITGTPPIIARMCFPRGSGCLKIPYDLEPRFSSTKFLCRLRATKTLLRWATEERSRACLVACRACEQHKWQRWNTASAALTTMLAGMRATCAAGGSRARGWCGQEHFSCTLPLCAECTGTSEESHP
jgi:hypothetical protein